MHQIIQEYNREKIQNVEREIPDFRAGDLLKVHLIIREGEKTRKQLFQGICIRRKGALFSKSFTVRKITSGYGVEKTFPLYSTSIDKIEVLKRGKVRRNKLYYYRNLKGKSFRVKELRSVRPLKSKTK